MEAFISWVGAALGALFAVAVLVAWWEHLVRNTRRPAAPPAPTPPRAVSVDMPLDALTPPTPGDAAERQAALDGALARMASPSTIPTPNANTAAWIETEPMVLSPAPEPASKPVSSA
jgi:hypothetical protein